MSKPTKSIWKTPINWLLGGIIILALIACATVLFFYFNTHGSIGTGKPDWGAFGDFIGGSLNPILSFLGLIALLATIALQSIELEATRAELTRSANAQESAQKLQEEQAATQTKQQFEGTFFSLLGQHNIALEKLSQEPSGNTMANSDLIHVRSSVFDISTKDLAEAKEKLESLNQLSGHYFRILYQLLKLIATNCPGSKIKNQFDIATIKGAIVTPEEKMYSNIVRAFLGYEVTQLLAINCYAPNESDSYYKYQLLIERYAFFEHMPFTIGGNISHLLTLAKIHYAKEAFGNSDFI